MHDHEYKLTGCMNELFWLGTDVVHLYIELVVDFVSTAQPVQCCLAFHKWLEQIDNGTISRLASVGAPNDPLPANRKIQHVWWLMTYAT